jgi:hypothetical protein
MKRYFRVATSESEHGPGHIMLEFIDDEPRRQVERYGEEWFAYDVEHSVGLTDRDLDETLRALGDPSNDGSTSSEEIDRAVFETAWNEALRRGALGRPR